MAVDIGGAEFTACCWVFDPHDYRGLVGKLSCRTPYSPLCQDSFLSMMSSGLDGVDIGDPAVSTQAQHPEIHRVRHVGHQGPDFLIDLVDELAL